MTDKIIKALETVNDLHGETLRDLDDDIQTVQIDYAEAMEMLWRQSQTIKRLQQENEKLRAALKECAQDLEAEINARYQIDGKVHPAEQRKYDRDMSTVRAAAAALKETGDDYGKS